MHRLYHAWLVSEAATERLAECRCCSILAITPKCTAYIAQPAWGWSVVGLLAGATALYVGLGMLHGSQVKGRRGWEALPHREFWVEARGMAEDGVRFASGRQQSGRRAGPREPLVSREAAPSEAPDAAKEDRRRGKEKKQKREKKSRQPSRHPERAAAGDGDEAPHTDPAD